MKKSIWFAIVLMLVGALLMAACGGGDGGNGAKVNRPNPPSEYANLTNPVAGNAEAAAAGKDLYTTNCASCHGDTGKGDGPSAAALDPKPRDLSDTANNASDAYSHWVIAEGGAAANMSSSMPAFKGVLSDEQIWQLVEHIKTFK